VSQSSPLARIDQEKPLATDTQDRDGELASMIATLSTNGVLLPGLMKLPTPTQGEFSAIWVSTTSQNGESNANSREDPEGS
jgi:hypothetical protein